MTKKSINRLIDAENRLAVSRVGGGVRELAERGEDMRKHRLVVTQTATGL